MRVRSPLLVPAKAGIAGTGNRNRAYHPGFGRFLQRDPIGQAGGLNIYNYTGNAGLCLRSGWRPHS
ncbi:RHS repeat-associated core domain-containing protein [Hyphobacterium sp.]|uniref:RHS repeat-associated core domain-containing protein n=1 Tax=Hyphobacterium sp. TaxID=2004662 RepID=UPI003BAB1B85